MDKKCHSFFVLKGISYCKKIGILDSYLGNNFLMDRMIFPLGSGVGLYDNDRLCVSVIDTSGSKKVGGRAIKPLHKFFSLPIIRGLVFFFMGIYLYISSFVLMQELDERPESEKNKSYKIAKNVTIASTFLVMVAMLIASFLFGLLVLGVLPSYLYRMAFFEGENYYFKRFIIALIRFSLLYVIFIALRFMPLMGGIYGFNGAGNVLLSGKEDSIRPRTFPLNFLNYLLNVFLFSTFVISLVGINIFWPINFVINLGILIAMMPIVYEVLRFASLSKMNWPKDVAIVTNWLVAIRPNITHSEVLKVAEVELENYQDFVKLEKDRVSMSSIFAEMEGKLKSSDRFTESDRDWIIGTVLNKSRAEVKLARSASTKEYREIIRACDRRAKGEPLSSIFGFVEFYGLRFDVNKKVLSPRMETEILVEETLKKISEFDAKNVLDLCTGSGAIAITLAKYSDAKIFACDISKGALAVAEANAKKNEVKVEFCLSDLFKSLKKGRKYDIIVSNPPYIKSSEIEKLDIEVKKYDPRLALDGGEDGLDYYRKIIDEAKSKLNKKGWLMFEVGAGQSDKVIELMQKAGYDNVQAEKDYNKIERVIYGRYSK